MRILVTGATGFIGQHLVTHLLDLGHSVTVLVREAYGMGHPFPKSLAAIRAQFETVYADLRNARLTTRAVQEAEPTHIIHLAAAGVTNPYLPIDTALRHNLSGTLNLLKAAFENSTGVRQILVARTPGERMPTNVYAASKAAAWQFCILQAATEARPIHGAMIFQAYGPDQPSNTLIPSAFRAALAGEPFPMTSGTQERDWIYIDDVVRGLSAALDAPLEPGTTVELGTGIATTVAGVVSQIYALVDAGGEPQPGRLADRPGEPQRQIANADQTSTLLDWQSTISLAQGLQRTLKIIRR